MNLKGIIFDLDGVLVDSIPLHYKAWYRMFTEYGYEFSEGIYRSKVDGRPRLDGVRNIMTDAEESQIQQAATVKQQYYLDMLEAGGLITFPSTIPLIKKLREHDVLLATASSSVNAKAILESIGILDDFYTVVTSEDITDGKPHPEIFITAANRMGLVPSECVVLEDAQSGIEAAKRGGFYCVGVDRHQQPQYFSEADLVVRDLGELDYQTLSELHHTNQLESSIN